jgi:hypothetical protein
VALPTTIDIDSYLNRRRFFPGRKSYTPFKKSEGFDFESVAATVAFFRRVNACRDDSTSPIPTIFQS